MTITTSSSTATVSPWVALFDLVVFLGVMFGVREFHMEALGWGGNVLGRTGLTLLAATLLLRWRGQSWKTLGLRKPDHWGKALCAAALVVVGSIAAVMLFELLVRDALFGPEEIVNSSVIEVAETSLWAVLGTLLVVWTESAFEELQDRGFSLNRFESLFGKVPWPAVWAVLMQAIIFGFRHSYDLSPRSVTTGLIGAVFGAVYVLLGRNLWPLIVGHMLMNTLSIADQL